MSDRPQWAPLDEPGASGSWPGWAPGPGDPGDSGDPGKRGERRGPAGPGSPALPKAGTERTGPLPLHPMTLPDILDGAFNLLRAEARSILLVTAAFLVPVQILAAFFQRGYFDGAGIVSVFNDPSVADAAIEAGDPGQALALSMAAVVTVVVLPFVAGAVSRIVSAAYLGERMTAGEALRAIGSKWWVFVVAWILVHVVEIVGLVMCVLPGLLAMALFIAVAPAIAVERLGPIKAMRRSARLVRPRLFPVLGIALLSGLMASIIGNVLATAPTTAAFLIGLEWGWPLLAVGGILNGLVATPVVAIIATLVYFDGRIRQEGLDLELMASDLARGDAPR